MENGKGNYEANQSIDAIPARQIKTSMRRSSYGTFVQRRNESGNIRLDKARAAGILGKSRFSESGIEFPKSRSEGGAPADAFLSLF